MNKRQQKDMIRLAEFLVHEVKDEWFNLSSWATEGFTEEVCGTTACAMGWASAALQDREIYMDRHNHWLTPWFYSRTKIKDLDWTERDEDGGYWYSEDFAAAALFGITLKDVDFLFMPHRYARNGRSRTHVAKRLVQFAKKAEIER